MINSCMLRSESCNVSRVYKAGIVIKRWRLYNIPEMAMKGEGLVKEPLFGKNQPSMVKVHGKSVPPAAR